MTVFTNQVQTPTLAQCWKKAR